MVEGKIFVAFVFGVLLISLVSALSFKVTPARYEINFVPGSEETFTFTFGTDVPDMEFKIIKTGDLTEYVSVSPEKLVGGGEVTVTLKLPNKLEKPGRYRLFIGSEPVTSTDASVTRRGSALGIAAVMNGAIDVFVPFPGKYGEIDFKATDANPGQPVNMGLKIFSRGSEEIVTDSRIEIYEAGSLREEEEKGILSPLINIFLSPFLSPEDRGELVETLELGTDNIPAGEFVDINARLDTTNYVSGNYFAVPVVTQGNQVIEEEAGFRLGELFVDIVGNSKEFERGKVNAISIEIQSFWNEPISNVFVTGEILGYEDLSFQTPSVSLRPWAKRTVTGYFDTSSIEEDRFQAILTAHYGGKTTEKIVNLQLTRKSDYVLISLIVVAILAAALFAWVVFGFLKSRRKKRGKKK